MQNKYTQGIHESNRSVPMENKKWIGKEKECIMHPIYMDSPELCNAGCSDGRNGKTGKPAAAILYNKYEPQQRDRHNPGGDTLYIIGSHRQQRAAAGIHGC